MNAYAIICTFGIVVMLAAASVQWSKIDEGMTDDEIVNLFHTTRDKIPEYDVALVRHNLVRYKRSNQNLRMQFNAFGEKIDAHLHPSDGQLMGENTPVWLAFTKLDGTVEYKKMREGIVGQVVSRFFTSPTDYSTVVVNKMKGDNVSFNGIVGNLILRPLPKRFQEEAQSGANSTSTTSNANSTMLDTDYYVIIKAISVADVEKITRLERQIREALQPGDRTDASRVERWSRKIIYPSLLVQTDFKGSKMTQNDLYYDEEIIYQLAFWNAVDLRFRQVNDPKIRLRIAGIIIGQDRNATPYLQNHRSGNVANMDLAEGEMHEYWYNMSQREDFPHEAYDIVVTMTDTDMSSNGNIVAGYAAITLCDPPWNNKFYAIATIRDNGGFDGILVAAHELGHVLGLDHDPESGDECDTSNGFIMQAERKPGPRNLEWSSCSLRTLSYYSRDPDINCYDEPAEFHPPGHPVQRVLAGDVWGAHKQCQARGYTWACDPSPDTCTQMQCYYTHWPALWNGWWCKNVGPAAEGTLCGPGRKCIDGVCQCMTEDCIYNNRPAGS